MKTTTCIESSPWTTRDTVLLLTSLPFLIAARWYWQTHVGIWPCVLFWIIALADDPLRIREMGGRRKLFYGMAFLGGIGNAIATLSNGGTMPVSGDHKFSPDSVWVPMTESSHCQWLCDIYSGCSIGDFFIFGAIICLIVNWALEKWDVIDKEAFAKGKRLPAMGVG